MMAAARLACSLNRIDQLVVDRQQKLLETLELPVSTQTLNGIENENLWASCPEIRKTLGVIYDSFSQARSVKLKPLTTLARN